MLSTTERRDRQVRRHTEEDIVTLEACRNRHAQYKTDEHLQATHAAFPWLVTVGRPRSR